MKRGRKPEPWKYRCECGQAKSLGSQRCQTCHMQQRHDRVLRRTCQSCGREFRRKHSLRSGHDVLRFCSKKCWGVFQTALAHTARDAYRRARQIQRELTRAQRLEARKHCACGVLITHQHRDRRCSPCIAAAVRAKRAADQMIGDHVCPNCGGSFHRYGSAVFCSPRCGRQYKHDRYPTLRALPVDKRNQIAELVALVRSARRRIDENSKSATG